MNLFLLLFFATAVAIAIGYWLGGLVLSISAGVSMAVVMVLTALKGQM